MSDERQIAENPYPGPRPFVKDEKDIFFGRTRELYDLFDLVLTYPVVLLYAQSGAGKTSLVNAGVRPRLEEENVCFARLRVSADSATGESHNSSPNIYIENALSSLATEQVDLQTSVASLSQVNWPDHEVILCFDQFEEIFTNPERWRDREVFFEDIAKLLTPSEHENIHVLFVIREDYLATMLSYAAFFPKGLSIRYRLERLRTEGALQAITQPAAKYGKTFEPNVAEQLVKDLSEIRTEPARGLSVWRQATSVAGEYVEPVHLQVVCTRLWTSLPNTKTIEAKHAKTYGDVDSALTAYYEMALAAALETHATTEEQLRNWFETKLLTSGGTRGLVYEGSDQTEGMPNPVVKVLAERHVIRAEPRAAGRWYELTHDRFINPILDSNKAWRQRRTTIERTAVALGGPAIAVSLMAAVAALVYFVAAFLPPIGPDQKPLWSAPVVLFGRTMQIEAEIRLFWLVALAAGCGSCIRTVLSFSQTLLKGALTRSWIIWFVLQIPLGIALSVLVYLQIRAVLLPDRLASANLNVYGFLAMSGLIGLYSPQAVAFIRDAVESLLGSSSVEGDKTRAHKLSLIRPRIAALQPDRVLAGSGRALVRVQGENFEKNVIVLVNGAARRSVFASTSEMIVYLEPLDTGISGVLRFLVCYPPPSDVASEEVLLPVYAG